MRTRIVQSISELRAADWNALLHDKADNPFLKHEFLLALETSGCASDQTGWHPCHALCEAENGTLLGALPLYLKTNSYGEFVFDFAWAGAYERAGLAYYPKLVSAIPFTPATGPRFLLAANSEPVVASLLLQESRELASRCGASSLHILFPDSDSQNIARQGDMLMRKDCQFHWQNRGYGNFDDFLDTFTAAKRKKARRERRRVTEAGIIFQTLTGGQMDEKRWDSIMPLYASTFLRRGREPYLSQDFFMQLCESIPDNLVIFAGYRDDQLVGVAICFRSDTHLYGRYWGANEFVDSLHFETCYYQGIDYCIQHDLQFFEPGTQGEHKISRGFVPVETSSAHWLSHPQFAAAIDEYLDTERQHVERYMDALGEHVPYKRGV
jgi:predicted N-acyltransferase